MSATGRRRMASTTTKPLNAVPSGGSLYRLATPATPTPHQMGAQSVYGQAAPKPFAAGSVANGAERSRLLELLRAPNSLTSASLEPSSKGLLNGPGQNNCFLNCAVQILCLRHR
ncbi:GL26824 [Drosophila persimilis]|uniref:GL26824 n=1 Tax=Drosophila persimilis TaxID=7234 RepID=B4H2E4_DROPE|nr:GL26824 [Drosophila persimilis]